MSTLTAAMGLIKPDLADPRTPAPWNLNFDLIDTRLGVRPTSLTSTTTLALSGVYLANGTFTVTLPTLNGSITSQNYNITVKNVGTGTITLTPTSGTIDGQASVTISTRYTSVMLMSDGTNWFITNWRVLTAADVSAGNFPAGVYNIAQTANTLPLQVGNGAGTGAGGYVQIGTTGTDSGYIGVEGTATNASLFLSAKGTGSIQISSAIASSKNISAPTFQGSGTTLGTTSGSRYVGATASVAPTTGTFLLGDFVITQTGHVYICTTAGSPGTWTEVGTVITGAVTMSSNLAVSGNISTSGGSITSTLANGGIELGSLTSANTPFIDLHSNGTNTDYDVRLLASGGTATIGQGNLTITAAATIMTGTLSVTSLTTSAGAGAQWGGAATTGLYVDAANMAIRLPSTTGVIYLQAPGGSTGRSASYTPATGVMDMGSVNTSGSTTPSFFSSTGTNTPISVVYNGASADNASYGVIGITAPATLNQAYYSMTAAGNAVYGMGMGTNNTMRLGGIGTGKAMNASAVEINASADVITPGTVAASKFTNTGVTGAATQTRWVGGTASVAPTTGTWVVGDFVISATGHIYVCTVAGTPGTWVDAGSYGAGGGGSVTSVANTWTATQTHQTSDGSATMLLSARTTANGGQTANLLEFRDPGGTNWSYVDASGNFVSLVSINGGTLVAGNALGTVGQLIMNKTAFATSGATTKDSAVAKFRTAYWNGSASVDEELALTGVRFSATVGDTALQADHALSLKDISTTLTTISGQVSVYSTGGRGKIKDGVGNVWNLDSSQLTRLAADVTSTSITSPPATSSTLATGTLGVGTYAYEINGAYRMSAAVGLALSINFSGTQTAINQGGFIATGPAVSTNVTNFANNTRMLGASVTATATDYPFQLTGTVVVTVAGALTLNFGASAAATATMRIGSYLRLTRIA